MFNERSDIKRKRYLAEKATEAGLKSSQDVLALFIAKTDPKAPTKSQRKHERSERILFGLRKLRSFREGLFQQLSHAGRLSYAPLGGKPLTRTSAPRSGPTPPLSAPDKTRRKSRRTR